MSKPVRQDRFFIVGCGRSGTTLLKTILSSHPEIYVCPETFFFRSVRPRLHSAPDTPEAVASAWWLADAGLSSDKLKPLIEARKNQGKPLECATLAAILDFHAAAHPNMIIGEKTPDHVNHLDAIRDCFSGAKIVQIMRDPRAVLASYRKVKVGSNAVADIASEWASGTSTLENWAARSDFLPIRYEDLVTDPESTLRDICVFLGVDFSLDMLNFHTRETDGFSQEQTHHANTRRALFTDSIEAWKKQLPRRDVALLEWALGTMMVRHGYELKGEKIHFGRIRMAASRVGGILHKAFVRFPRQRWKALRASRRLRREVQGK